MRIKNKLNQFQKMEAYFVFENGQILRSTEEKYHEWEKTFRIDRFVKPFGSKTVHAAYNIFAQYDGYVDYFEEGMEVAPFVLHVIVDYPNDPGNRKDDDVMRFTNLAELISRRLELIKLISA